MAEFDPQAFYEEFGIETRLGGEPSAEPPLSSAGAQAQADLLHELAGVSATIKILEALIRDHPNADDAFEAVNANFGRSLEEARAAFRKFRERRDCRGAA